MRVLFSHISITSCDIDTAPSATHYDNWVLTRDEPEQACNLATARNLVLLDTLTTTRTAVHRVRLCSLEL